MLAVLFFILFFFCFVFFFGWNQANNALNRGDYIEPHFRLATYWFAEWGLWPPVIIILLTTLSLGLFTFLRSRPRRIEREDEPEDDVEKRIDDALDKYR